VTALGVAALEEQLGLSVDPELLVLALTHRSFAHEAGGIPTNERLEFLGDSVVGIVVTEHLYRTLPERPEGELAKMRAASVSQKALAATARTLGLGEYVLLGKGELATGGREKDSILCDTFEAVVGAVYLCHGLETSRTLVERLVGPTLEAAATLGAGLDWKTSVQEVASARGLGVPMYVVEGTGPDHARSFMARVGPSKKAAEQQAAEQAYGALREQDGAVPSLPLDTA
jgi:ribonuclease III